MGCPPSAQHVGGVCQVRAGHARGAIPCSKSCAHRLEGRPHPVEVHIHAAHGPAAIDEARAQRNAAWGSREQGAEARGRSRSAAGSAGRQRNKQGRRERSTKRAFTVPSHSHSNNQAVPHPVPVGSFSAMYRSASRLPRK